jgi:hypothetical protein
MHYFSNFCLISKIKITTPTDDCELKLKDFTKPDAKQDAQERESESERAYHVHAKAKPK